MLFRSCDVAAQATGTGKGIEEAAREARYDFLVETAGTLRCTVVAVAHTADDLEETVLHHVLRGTGLAGLRGMPAERRLSKELRLVRPLLAVTRVSVLEYLATQGQGFREDVTNADVGYTRNRLRIDLLPRLRAQYNARVEEALCRLARQAEEAQAALASAAGYFLERAIDSAHRGGCTLKWQALAQLDRHLLREVFAELWRRQDWPRQHMGFEHWQSLAKITLEGGAAALPNGFHARRTGKLFVIERTDVHDSA